MKVEYLKRVRVGVSILFLAVTAFLFLDFTNAIPPAIAGGLVYLQFVPSLLKFLTLLGVASLGFCAVLILTVLFGRVYCSSICPLGTMQDIVSYVARKRQKRKWYDWRKPQTMLRYTILAATAAALAAGSGSLLLVFDPFSNAGRILSNLFRPIVVGVNNGIAYLLDTVHMYALYRTQVQGLTWVSVLFPLAVLLLVGWLAYRHGRLYCNALCPVGTLLGLVARYALVKVAIKEEDCISCGLCERVCKAECIDKKAKTVDMSRCVGCFNCFHACPTDGMTFTFPRLLKARAAEVRTDLARRNMLLGSCAFLAGMAGTTAADKKEIVATKESTVPIFKSTPVAPPGAGNIDHFTQVCTACHLCVSACPSHVLAPSFLEYGLLGMLQPRMDYASGYCNFDCVACGQVCPSGAILPLSQEQKKTTQLGTAKFVKENCIVETEGTDCGACSEHCPTKAVNMIPYKNRLVIPEVKNEYCVGCGACEHACPVKPYKAIYIEGNAVHKVAKKPEVQKMDQKVDFKEDFPF